LPVTDESGRGGMMKERI